MHKIIILAALTASLAACQEPPRCMGANESGQLIRVTGNVDRYCGRGGCYDTPTTTMLVRMPSGATRVCSARATTPDMLIVGERVNLPLAERIL